MNIGHRIAQACEGRLPLVICLVADDYRAAQKVMENTPPQGDAMTYRGVKIMGLSYSPDSFVVEDTPDGPLIHMLP